AGGEGVHQTVKLIVVTYRLGVDRGDERATMHLYGYPTFAFQRDQRLPDRDAADAKRLRDLLLWHPCARSELPVENQPPNVERNLLADTAADHPVVRRRQGLFDHGDTICDWYRAVRHPVGISV